jgi:hypothetical protein
MGRWHDYAWGWADPHKKLYHYDTENHQQKNYVILTLRISMKN